MSKITDLNARIRGNQVKSVNNIHQDEHEDQADARRVTLVDFLGNAINSSNRLPVDAIINITEGNPVDTPVVYRVPAALANTEYSQVLPLKTRKVRAQVRRAGAARLQISYELNGSGTNYWTVMPGDTYQEDGVELIGKVIYFQVSKPNTVVEIIAWT